MIKIFKSADKRKIGKLGAVLVVKPLQYGRHGPSAKRKFRERRGRGPPTKNGLCDCNDAEKNYKP